MFYNFYFQNFSLIFLNYNKRIINQIGNCYIINCNFYKFSTLEKGSTIYYFSNEINKILIENSQFINCFSFNSGGAIYFDCLNGSFIIYKVCAINCTTSNNNFYNFLYFNVKINSLNKINYLTISKSASNLIYSDHIIQLNSGNQSFQFSNLSFNYIQWYGISFKLSQ